MKKYKILPNGNIGGFDIFKRHWLWGWILITTQRTKTHADLWLEMNKKIIKQ